MPTTTSQPTESHFTKLPLVVIMFAFSNKMLEVFETNKRLPFFNYVKILHYFNFFSESVLLPTNTSQPTDSHFTKLPLVVIMFAFSNKMLEVFETNKRLPFFLNMTLMS